ncbi:hypothetical protein GA0061103_0959 [Rhizobium multihospitium]|uniref:Uncharacterized protein n=1 Tax=Rhizobium multihospitium TaxID=410764 RepID=A0A1C3XG13_9HYPH|nr:hypothetical protein GA0061103_0959 [Rhizobium multihospitium]
MAQSHARHKKDSPFPDPVKLNAKDRLAPPRHKGLAAPIAFVDLFIF